MVRTEPLGGLLGSDLRDIGHVAGDTALDNELTVDLHLGKGLLNADREVSAILLGVFLLDGYPGAAEVLVKGERQEGEEERAHHEECPA